MANNGLVYDKDADTENSPVQHAQSNNQNAENKSLDSNSLNESENGGLYKPDGSVSTGSDSESSDTLGKGFTGGKKGALKSRLLSSRRNKMILLGVGGSGAGAVLVVVLLLLIASSLKIPNLAQHITAYEFARITRQFSDSAKRLTSEKLVLSSELDAKSKLSFSDQVKAKYPDSLGKAGAMLDKLSSFKPENVIKTMGQENNMRWNFTNGKFTGGELNGKIFDMKKAGTFTGKVPLLRDAINFKGQLQFSRDFAPALDSAMKLNDVGPIIRGATAREVRQRLGIGLIAWNLGKFQGKTAAEAQREEIRQKESAIGSTSKPTSNSNVTEIKDAAKAAAENEAKITADDALIDDVFKNGGVATSTQKIIDDKLGSSLFKTVISVGSPFYAIALPVCIVFDGSITNSESTINNNTQKQQSAYYQIAKAADQQKQGSIGSADDQNLAKAVNATNADLGNISGSIPEIRASGGSLDDGGVGISAEASASGQYSLLSTFLGSNGFTTGATDLLESSCSLLTDPRLAVAFIGFQVVGNYLSGGGLGAGEAAAQAGAKVVVDKVAQSVADKVVSRTFAKLTGKAASEKFTIAATRNRAGKFIWGNVKSIAAVTGATVMAKILVMQQSGLLFSGFSQGEDLANMAAAGGNIQAGELSRQQTFGRPLTNDEVAQSDQVDGQYIAYQNASKSFGERYFSTHNADSLVTHMAMGVSATFHGGLMASLIKIGGYILQPFTHFGALFGSLIGSVHAAPDPNTQHYGNVQFGWSQAEENMINIDGSYQPLENQLILDDNKETVKKIAQDYAQCFGYTSDKDGNLTPISSNSGEGTLGNLFATEKILRNEDGSVIPDKGLCSPNNLGMDSPDKNSADSSSQSPKKNDMIMRWRLAMFYGTTVDQLTNMQDVTN